MRQLETDIASDQKRDDQQILAILTRVDEEVPSIGTTVSGVEEAESLLNENIENPIALSDNQLRRRIFERVYRITVPESLPGLSKYRYRQGLAKLMEIVPTLASPEVDQPVVKPEVKLEQDPLTGMSPSGDPSKYQGAPTRDRPMQNPFAPEIMYPELAASSEDMQVYDDVSQVPDASMAPVVGQDDTSVLPGPLQEPRRMAHQEAEVRHRPFLPGNTWDKIYAKGPDRYREMMGQALNTLRAQERLVTSKMVAPDPGSLARAKQLAGLDEQSISNEALRDADNTLADEAIDVCIDEVRRRISSLGLGDDALSASGVSSTYGCDELYYLMEPFLASSEAGSSELGDSVKSTVSVDTITAFFTGQVRISPKEEASEPRVKQEEGTAMIGVVGPSGLTVGTEQHLVSPVAAENTMFDFAALDALDAAIDMEASASVEAQSVAGESYMEMRGEPDFEAGDEANRIASGEQL